VAGEPPPGTEAGSAAAGPHFAQDNLEPLPRRHSESHVTPKRDASGIRIVHHFTDSISSRPHATKPFNCKDILTDREDSVHDQT
jgi:hypothetical protein